MTESTKSDFYPRFDPAFQRGFDPATPVREAVPAASPAADGSGAISAPVVNAVQDAGEPASPPGSGQARNPFLVVLGIIAVVLVGVGIWLFVQSGNAFNSHEVRSQGDYMTIYATILMAPYISLLGVATAIGVLFLFAARWRKRA